MPVLFTKKGFIHLHRKIVGPSEEEREEAEREAKKLGKAKTKEDELEELHTIDQTISMEWLNSNLDCEIIQEEKEVGYHTYGYLIGNFIVIDPLISF